MPAFVLVHAPLLGPAAWEPVADELRRRDTRAVVPRLPDAATAAPPYWPACARAVAAPLLGLPTDEALLLVAHSGAGNLLPLVRAALDRPPDGYLFVDAMVPEDGRSPLDLMEPDDVAYFRGVAAGGLIPPFPEALLRAAGIEDEALLSRLVDQLRPLPLAVYEEPLPVPAGWPDAPCAYLRFARTAPSAYERSARRAHAERWPYRELDGGHLHLLADPAAVAEALLDLARQMRPTR